jgi:predicted secreted Zn-dependent protease
LCFFVCDSATEGSVLRIITVISVLLCAFSFAVTAQAKPKIAIKTKFYEVKGKDGEEVLRNINRKGPRHGFLVRAIAQTQYTLSYGYDTVQSSQGCSVTKAEVKMDIVYVFPKLAGKNSRHLNTRWKQFMAGVQKHEETHGSLARQMASATEKALLSTHVSGKRGCGQIKNVAKRNVDKVFKIYERQQVAFDKKEHRDNGNVEKLVTAFVK